MVGKVAYHGDLWLRKDFRGKGLVKVLAAITHRMTLAMWAPDFVCALVERWTLDGSMKLGTLNPKGLCYGS
ncbi:hypothetical protein ACM41_05345 [Bradyrhizobium sp. CCBAU 21362]|nr:hypothetical protein [Bradyrhizobium sp. CCBAU 21362]